MKKSKLSLISLLIISMLTSLLPFMTAEAALGVKNYMFPDTNVRRGGRGEYIVLEDVDFNYGFTSFDLLTSIGWSATTDVSVTLDRTNGTEIARWIVSDYTGYTAFTRRTDRIQLNQEITGVHDVYFNVKGGEVCCISATFYYLDGSTSVYKPYGTVEDEDLAASENLHKITFLESLGMFDTTDESFSMDIPLTRINYLRALSGFYKADELPEVPIDVFTDIKEEDSRKIAYFLYLKGAIVLEDTAYLKPYEYITPREAAEYAANMLGYPGDMRVIAKLEAGEDSEDGYMRVEQMADILYNAAFHDYRVGYKTKSGAVWYEEVDDFFLNYTKKFKVGEGLVTANSYTSIYSAADATEDYHVRINDTDYNIGVTNADEYLGVYAYYVYGTDKNGIETIHAIAPKHADYITQLDSTLDYTEISSNKIEYLNDKNKTKEIKLQGSTSIIYNGKALDVDIQTVITNPKNFRGKIVAIDNDKDKYCDVLVIMNAESFVINSVTEQYISSTDNPSVHNYTFEEGSRVEFLRNGALANAVDFAKGECVDIYVSQSTTGAKLYQIVYSPQSKDVVLSGISDGGTVLSFDDGTSYKLSPASVYVNPQIGDSGTFHINNFGEVVYYTAIAEDDLTIGWLYKVTHNDEDERAFAFIKTTDNKTAKYEFAKKLYVDGVRIKTYEEFKSGKSGAVVPMVKVVNGKEENKEFNEPVLFKVDENNLITILDTIYTTGNVKHAKGEAVSKFNSLIEKLAYGTYKWDDTGLAFYQPGSDMATSIYLGMLATTDENTLTFADTDNDEMDTFMTNKSIQKGDSTCTGYTIGKSDSMILDIMKVSESTGGTKKAPFVVQTVEQIVDGYGEVKTVIKGISSASAAEYFVSDVKMSDPDYAAKINVVKPGDFIRVGVDSGNNILDLQILHYGDNTYTNVSESVRNGIESTLHYEPVDSSATADAKSAADAAEVYRADRMFACVGTIKSYGDDYVTIERINTKTTEDVLMLPVTIVNVGDRGLDISTSTSYNSLNIGQKVIVYYYNYRPSAYYVYDNMN